MTEAFFFVDIFIAYIYAADKSDLSVDDRYFAVITIIHNNADDGHEFIEHHRLYAIAAQCLTIISRKIVGTADIVVYNAYINTLRDLAPQHVEYRVPHMSRVYDKILKENEFFRLFKLRDESCEHVLADREILRFRIAAGSVAAVGLKIFKKSPCAVIVDLLGGRGAHGVVPRGLLKLNIEFIPYKPCRALVAEQDVHKSSEQRKKRYKQHPADLI